MVIDYFFSFRSRKSTNENFSAIFNEFLATGLSDSRNEYIVVVIFEMSSHNVLRNELQPCSYQTPGIDHD